MAKPYRQRGKWRIKVVGINGRTSCVFDSYQEAVKWAREIEQERDEVRVGRRKAPPPTNKTFGELCDYWEENQAKEKRSGTHDSSIIRAHLRPALGKVLLRDIGQSHRDAFVKDRAHLNKKTIHNHLTLLIAMLNVAVDLGWLHSAPRIRKPKVRLFSKDFRFLRNESEIARFLRAARDVDDLREYPRKNEKWRASIVFNLYATAIYTGMREGELAALEWDDIDLERRLITVQRSFDGPTKADDVRYVPILDPLLPILKSWRVRCPTAHLFPNQRGEMFSPSSRIFQEVLHRILDRAGFPDQERSNKVRKYIVFHDLRHTFASLWVMRGGSVFTLSKILGHKSVQMTMRYAHLAPDAYSEEYGRLGSELPPMDAHVVEFPNARRC